MFNGSVILDTNQVQFSTDTHLQEVQYMNLKFLSSALVVDNKVVVHFFKTISDQIDHK